MRKTKIKHIAITFLFLALLLSIAGCTTTKENTINVINSFGANSEANVHALSNDEKSTNENNGEAPKNDNQEETMENVGDTEDKKNESVENKKEDVVTNNNSKTAISPKETKETHTIEEPQKDKKTQVIEQVHTHEYHVKQVVSATCTESGYSIYSCNCGQEYCDNYVEPMNHNWSEWITVKEPTTSECGEQTSTCLQCNTAQTKQLEKLQVNHEPTTPSVPTLPNYTPDEFAVRILEEVNRIRIENGLLPLSLDYTLCKLAYVRAEEASVLWSHTRPNGESATSVFAQYNVQRRVRTGENLANYGSQNVDVIVRSWMNSQGHKANILHTDYTTAGIGVHFTGTRYYIANVFNG